MGAIRNGDGSVRPNRSTPVSRSATSRSIRGTIRPRSNAARFARMVAPVPAPPATYANASADIALRARSSSMVASVGTRGRRPLTPAA
jgi:hypothetical protein